MGELAIQLFLEPWLLIHSVFNFVWLCVSLVELGVVEKNAASVGLWCDSSGFDNECLRQLLFGFLMSRTFWLKLMHRFWMSSVTSVSGY